MGAVVADALICASVGTVDAERVFAIISWAECNYVIVCLSVGAMIVSAHERVCKHVPACLQVVSMRVSVYILICASMVAAVLSAAWACLEYLDARERVYYYHLCQHGSCGVCSIICASMGSVVDARERV